MRTCSYRAIRANTSVLNHSENEKAYPAVPAIAGQVVVEEDRIGLAGRQHQRRDGLIHERECGELLCVASEEQPLYLISKPAT